ncbi:hypothetical protein FOZ60_006804 [Perkinsus olseni]|uniref:Uncharacterized protein n=1 Tax=Perkinsus olseni TaxID=32597 RepID=A0A7J6NN10_PEROL|nr:hypothetical protein FOZ60_006804 [Perkinsus olseni]
MRNYRVFHRLFLVAYIVSMVMSGVGRNGRTLHRSLYQAKPLSVTADYPPGCNGGPGPAKHGDSIHVQTGSCIYNMEGCNLHGVHQESTGIMIKSNMPGRDGDLKLQFNTMADGPEGTSIKMVSVNISGSANLETNEDGVYVWWNPGGRDVNYEARFGGIPNIEVPSRIYVCLPSGEKASNGKYNVRGWANTGKLSLQSDASARSHSGEVMLYTAQSVEVTKEWFKEEQGWIAAWRYDIYHMVEGSYVNGSEPFESF